MRAFYPFFLFFFGIFAVSASPSTGNPPTLPDYGVKHEYKAANPSLSRLYWWANQQMKLRNLVSISESNTLAIPVACSRKHLFRRGEHFLEATIFISITEEGYLYSIQNFRHRGPEYFGAPACKLNASMELRLLVIRKSFEAWLKATAPRPLGPAVTSKE